MNALFDLLDNEGFPSFPSVVTAIQQCIQRDDATFGKIATLVDTDLALKIMVTRAANSPIYKTLAKIDETEPAIKVLGFQRVLELTYTCALKSAIPDSTGVQSVQFWKSSLLIALLARKLGEKFSYEQPSRLFTLGLLSNCGLLIKLLLDPAHMSDIIKEARELNRSRYSVEFKADNADDGTLNELCLEYWGFAPAVRTPIRFALQPDLTPTEYQRETDLLHVAIRLSEIYFDDTQEFTTEERSQLNEVLERLETDKDSAQVVTEAAEKELEVLMGLIASNA